MLSQQSFDQIVLSPNGVLGVLSIPKISEADTFISEIPFEDVFDRISSKKRALEIACAHHLVRVLTGEWQMIHRAIDGRPFLKDSDKNLSISHDSSKVCAIVSSCPSVAVDIESLERDVSKIKHKFCSETELKVADTSEIINPLLRIWGAKECLFKVTHQSGIDFKTQLSVDLHSESLVKNQVIGHIKTNKPAESYRIHQLMHGNHIINYINE